MTTAVITGIGLCAATGLGHSAHWRSTLRGESAIRPIERFDTSRYWSRIGGEVPNFDPAEHLQSKLLPQTDHMTRLALVATDWALFTAGLRASDLPDYDMAVVTAATAGGYEFGQRELQKLWNQGPDFVSAYQSFAWFYAVNTGQISIRHKMRGPGAVVISEQAGGLDAIGHARRQLSHGVQMALTGGIDSSMCPWAWVAHQASGSLSRRNDPERAYLPFDEDANGHVVGEGGAIFVMETAESAARRSPVRAYGEIAGYAATFDSQRPGAESGLKRAAQQALIDANLTPSDIDVVFADAAADPDLDRIEAAAIKDIFGPHGVPVTAPKTMTGRLFAGGGALDLANALLSMWDSAIPPTVNIRNPVKEYQLDLVLDEPRFTQVRAALVLGRGRGGFNSAIVVRKPSTL